MRTLTEFLDAYRESHRHPVNVVVHVICVPLIFFSTLGLLWG
ncbi:MAG: Mpo1-like protein, partial [Perlucidibaca sp.]